MVPRVVRTPKSTRASAGDITLHLRSAIDSKASRNT
jgi:hypothetical protein